MQIFERALIVVGHTNDELTVYGKNGYVVGIKQNIDKFVERKCRNFGNDFNTAKHCFRNRNTVRKNSPICVCVTRKIFFYSIDCTVTNQPIWFRYSPNMKYRKIDENRYGIFYDQELLIIATFSKHKFDTQVKRIKDFINGLIECYNCPRLGCINCL
jgi:competence transcription factor ComK